MCLIVFLRLRPPPRSSRTDPPFPYTQLFRSAEYAALDHVTGLRADRVDAEAADEDDRREQQAVRHLPEAYPDADERQIDDDQHEIADPHRGDHAPEHVRMQQNGRAECRERVWQYV